MKTTTISFRILIALILMCLTGCSAAHVIVGKPRPATDPSQIKIFMSPPKHYETIAIVSSDNTGTLHFGAQARLDAALNKAKKDAAKLGANGLLLQTLGDGGGVIVGSGLTTGSSTTFLGVSGGGPIKSVSALAIYVTEE